MPDNGWRKTPVEKGKWVHSGKAGDFGSIKGKNEVGGNRTVDPSGGKGRQETNRLSGVPGRLFLRPK